MSRVAKSPVAIPGGVEVKLVGNALSVKGSKGAFEFDVHEDVVVEHADGKLSFGVDTAKNNWAMAGTMRALVNNMVTGVSEGFEKKLQLVGVGYRAQAQ
ncbi:unnamed protein product, partial [Cyprideis torosa]